MTIHPTAIRQAGSPAEQRFIDLYSDVSGRLPGAQNEAVRAWRETALDEFVRLGLPHRRVEEWKYTDLRTLMPEVYPLAGLTPQAMQDVSVEAAIGPELAAIEAWRAVFVNGQFRADLSDLTQAEGVIFNSFRAGIGSECAGQVLPEVQPFSGDAVSALAAAFATDGALIVVEPEVKLDRPIHLIFLTTGSSPVAVACQNVLHLSEGAEATLIETHAAALPCQSFIASHVSIGARAHFRHIRISEGQGAKQLAANIAKLGEAAQYDPLQFVLGGALTRAQSFIRFDGEGGRCHFTGASMLRGQDHADMTLLVDHAVPHCESRELAKAVLDDRARGVFQAKVLVRRDAQKTDGKQMSNALLLSNDAEFDAKPELEIYADDVVCGHGATAGQLDEDMMFYLLARGIPADEARTLLILAFIGEALDKIEHEELREALQRKAESWLAAGG